MQFHILNTQSYSSLSDTLIWCVTCLHYIDSFLMKNAQNNHFSSICSLKTQLMTPLVSFCDEYFWEIKENVTIEKTDMQYLYFEHIIGCLSFLHTDLICHMPMLNWSFPHEKYQNKRRTFTLVQSVVSKWAYWHLLYPSVVNIFLIN